MKPIVSIIIPCYNQAHYLTDAINSLKAQSFENWECIIVNDGSTDNTTTVAEELAKTDQRIRVINQDNKGLSGARNTGLIFSQGDLLQFLDADDMLEPQKLSSQSEYLNLHPEVDLVFSDARYFTTENPNLREYGFIEQKLNEPLIPRLWQEPGDVLDKLLHQNIFPVNCLLVRRTVFSTVGNWNEKLNALEDWEFWIRCAANNKTFSFFNSTDSMALVRMHLSSMSRDKRIMQHARFEVRVSIGKYLNEKRNRLYNFENGVRLLRNNFYENKGNLLLKLAYENFSFKVSLYAIFFLFSQTSFYQKANKIYSNSTPWPIQKYISNIIKMFKL